jgi:hypothetical protein
MVFHPCAMCRSARSGMHHFDFTDANSAAARGQAKLRNRRDDRPLASAVIRADLRLATPNGRLLPEDQMPHISLLLREP